MTTELEYYIDNNISGIIPVKVINQMFPYGNIFEDKRFTTHVNSYSDVLYQSAVESDLMKLEYIDPNKKNNYGNNVPEDERDDKWIFDPFHSQLEIQMDTKGILIENYGLKNHQDFVPNEVLPIIPPPNMTTDQMIKGLTHKEEVIINGKVQKEDYSVPCNLGNYGVTYKYTIILHNKGTADKSFKFNINSQGAHVYKYKLFYNSKEIEQAGFMGLTSKKRYYDINVDVRENIVDIVAKAGVETKIELEITMTTACNGTIQNYLIIEDKETK